MPIPVDRLREAQRPLEERVLEFLAQRKTEAFNLTEIYVGIEGLDQQTGPITFALMTSLQRTREHARFLQEQLRASLPVNRNEISSLLTRAKAILDQNPAANNKAK